MASGGCLRDSGVVPNSQCTASDGSSAVPPVGPVEQRRADLHQRRNVGRRVTKIERVAIVGIAVERRRPSRSDRARIREHPFEPEPEPVRKILARPAPGHAGGQEQLQHEQVIAEGLLARRPARICLGDDFLGEDALTFLAQPRRARDVRESSSSPRTRRSLRRCDGCSPTNRASISARCPRRGARPTAEGARRTRRRSLLSRRSGRSPTSS